ncbi:hypothetical protein JCM11251_007190 [Rhodosporidiobolus azoricus]
MSYPNGLKRQRVDHPSTSYQPSKRVKADAPSSGVETAAGSGNRLVGPWSFLSGGLASFRRVLSFGQSAASAPAPSTIVSHLPASGPSRPRTPATRKVPLIPSTFSPFNSSTPFRSKSDPELKKALRTALDDWHWARITQAGAGNSASVPKPPQLIALQTELMNRKEAKKEQQRSASKGKGVANGAAVSVDDSGSNSTFRRKAPMGKDRKRQIPQYPPVPRLEIDGLPEPTLFPKSRLRPSSADLPPSPSSSQLPLPRPPWAPVYDPATYSPPSTSTAPLFPRPRHPATHSTSSPSTKRVTITSSPPTLIPPRPSRRPDKQVKFNLHQRDLATIAQLQGGATVSSPFSSPTLAPSPSSSTTLRGGSSPSSAKYADLDADLDELYLGPLVSKTSLEGLIGQPCQSREERQRLADLALYERKMEEDARRQEGVLAGDNLKINHHRSSRRAPRHPTNLSIINSSTFFPEANPLTRYKPSKIPVPASRKPDVLDRAIRLAKKTLEEPFGNGESFERFDAMRKELAEAAGEEEEEVVTQKRRVWPAKLAPEHQKIVKAAWNNPSFHSSIPAADVEARNLRRLKDGDWLDDEVINFHGKLINMRSDAADKTGERGEGEKRLRKAFCFPTMFYNKLLEERGDVDKGFKNVKRWTKKIDTFDKDIIIVPINQGGNHWVCAAVNLKEKRFEYYDSLGKARGTVYAALRRWLELEHKTRKDAGKIKQEEWKELDISDWENYWDEDRPKQNNTCDCGVFTCWFMESLSRDYEGFDFSQENMPYLRRKLVLNIAQQELMETEEWE